MEPQNPAIPPQPPSLMKSLMAGFDAISNHIWLILFSIVLDVFLWFGPTIRLNRIVESFFNRMGALPDMQSADVEGIFTASKEFWSIFAEQFNLFSFLRTFPIGVPSLMISRTAVELPIGSPSTWEIPSLSTAFWIWLPLMAVGLIIGTLYFSVIAQAAAGEKVEWRQIITNLPRNSFQVLLLTIFCFVLFFVALLPLSCVMSILLITGLALEQVALIVFVLFAGLLIWLLFPLVFAPHGIFINNRKMWSSVKDGFKLTRMTLPTSSLLIVVIIVLSEGLDLLWKIPPLNSWLAAIGIIGHAFVTASLIATSFVFYVKADEWMKHRLEEVSLKLS